MEHSVLFGSKTIRFTLTYANRKTLGISVTPDQDVHVTAPEGATLEKVMEKVKKRAPWILRQQTYFLSFLPQTPAKQYIPGETHAYMGRNYLLRHTVSTKKDVVLRGRYLQVHCPTRQHIKPLVTQWYRQRSKTMFAQIAEPFIARFRQYNVQPTGLYIQTMDTRWGSCTPAGKIILNPNLIKAPRACIEYVIVHELCHLVHPNHSRSFFALQEREMPDWKKWKARLEQVS